ncbi:MAG: hypothetical protein ACOYJZ_06835 [Acutalibacter sp.]|jgi:Flp pilus assembly protein TadB
MSIAGTLILFIFPILFLIALAVGLVIFFVVRSNERKKREEFQRIQTQEAQRRSQEKELEKMKIDDL